MPRRKNWKKSLAKSDGERRVNLPSKKTEKMVNLPSKKTKAISIFADKENVEKTCQSTSQNVAQSTNQNVAQNTSQNVAQTTRRDLIAQSTNQQVAAQTTEKFNSVSILQGSFNQGDDRFSEISRGSQCTANALTALLFAKYSNLHSSTALDDVLKFGDNLYLQIITDLKISKRYVNNLLCFEDVPPCVEIFSKQIHIRKGDIISGCAITHFENNDLPTLHNALQTVLERVSSVLIIIGSICSAVFVHEDLFYFFDSHSHGSDGLSAPDGTALLISFEKLVDLIAFMYACYESMLIDLSFQFDVMPLSFVEREEIAKSCNSIEHTSLIDKYFKDQLCKSVEKSSERENVCSQIPVKRTELSATSRGNLGMAESKRSKSNIQRRKRSSSINEQDLFNECKSQRKMLKKTENVSQFQATDTKKLYMKNYMKLKRENKQYREKELKSKQLTRQNDLNREKEKQHELRTKRSARQDEQFREKEKQSKRSDRQDVQFREKEKQHELRTKRSARQDEQFREKEKQSKRSARQDEQFREKEKQCKRSDRQDVPFREKEKQHELRTKRLARQDEQFREKEKQSKRSARQDEQFREKEKQCKRSDRQDVLFREKEKQHELRTKRSARQDEQFREKEKQCKRSARQDEQFREKEKQCKRSARQDEQFREKKNKANVQLDKTYNLDERKYSMNSKANV